jgi:hypothetical protein
MGPGTGENAVILRSGFPQISCQAKFLNRDRGFGINA